MRAKGHAPIHYAGRLDYQCAQNKACHRSARQIESYGTRLDGANFVHLWHVVAQHVFDAMLQGHRRRWTTGTGPLHRQVNNAVVETMEHDITTIHGNGWAHTRIQKFLNLDNNFIIILITGVAALTGAIIACCIISQNWASSREMLHNDAKNAGLHQKPFAIFNLRNGDKIITQENAINTLNFEQAFSEGEATASSFESKFRVPSAKTTRPGKNFRVAGLGVVSV